MKPDVLAARPLYPPTMAKLEAAFTVHRLWQAEDREALVATVAERLRAIAAPGHLPLDPMLFDALPRLEIIAVFGVGVDGIDVERARWRGIAVTNTPDVLNEDVADLAVGLAIAVVRRLCVGDRYVRAGRWPDGDMPMTARLSGRRVGILGLGRIGLAIARRLESFRCPIAYHARNRRVDVPYAYIDSPVQLARDSDLLVVATPGGASTHRLVDRAVLDALGPRGVLVNVARGSVIDQDALVAALREGRLGGAGLDVFDNEPHVPEPLRAMDHVVLQPHVGSATEETREAMGDLMIANLQAHFAGRPLLTPYPV